MMPRVAVIGSGLTGLACAQALINRGLKPDVLDAGQNLPPAQAQLVERLRAQASSGLSQEDRARVAANDSLGRGKVPKKRVFGSDYYMATARPEAPLEVATSLPCGSFAKGGYSVAWGGAILPTHADDMADWPIRPADLEASYRRALALMPVSMREDDLAAHFPLLATPSAPPLAIPQQAQHILNALRRVKSTSDAPFLAGASRLAVDSAGCTYCGMCLSGCVYGKIFSSAAVFDRLHADAKLSYRNGMLVLAFRQVEGGVELDLHNIADETRTTERYDKVFLAAGAIQSTRIVMQSLSLFNTPVLLKDSQKYILPLLQWRRTKLEWPDINALASLFVDFKQPDFSPHWFHAQLSAISDLVLQGMGVDPGKQTWRKTLLQPGYERMMIAWGGLHSSLSSALRLVLEPGSAPGEASRLRITPEENPATRAACRAVIRHLAARLLPHGVLGLAPLALIGEPGEGNHFGASMPMRAHSAPQGLSTDLLGRLPGHPAVHIVDGAVLPAIPATTIALLQMANADRIATQVVFA